MRVCVVGAGSLGSLLAGLLASAADVTIVGRPADVEAIEADGLRVTGSVERHVHPDVTTEPPATADLAVVAVKTFDTEAVARQLADCDLGGVLSLQNGLGNEEALAAHVDCEVLAGTCTYGARRLEPGHVECTGVGEVALGARGGGESPLADRVGAVFADAGFETTVADDMPRRLWTKLAVNAGINPPTALARVDNGALVDGPASETARAAARETARVARSDGVDLSDAAAVRAVEDVARATAANVSSMRQDVEAGRRTEIDAIGGAVLERADEPVPTVETLTRLLRAWERANGLR